MSRLKLFLLLLIIPLLGIIFFQNQEPIALKLLCPDDVQSCFYQTPQLPLAIWIGLFVLAGMITNLFWQVLNSFSYSGSRKQQYDPYHPEELDKNQRNWATTDNKRDKYSSSTTSIQDDSTQEKLYSSTSYEVPQEPQNVERSGSNYSYKYREASERPQNSKNDAQKTSIEPELNLDNQEQDDEDWI